MAFLSGISEEDPVAGIFNWNMAAGRTISQWHEVVMRGESPLSVSERELLGAYTSALNACPLCYGVHKLVAESYGIEAGVIEALVDGIEAAPVAEKIKPLLAFVRKLNDTPAQMTQADADTVFAAGWSERALHDAIDICAMFNYMNRVVLGHGGDQGDIAKHLDSLAKVLIDGGYEQPIYTEEGLSP